MKKLLKQYSFLYLTPLLFIYIFIFLWIVDTGLGGDQERYLMYAKNLISGNYAIDNGTFLWNGPGYPIILAPFVYIGFSIQALKSLNVLFIFGGITFFHKTNTIYFSKRKALFFTYILGLYYPNIFFSLKYLLSEAFSFFLASGLLYFIIILSKKYTKKSLAWASIFLAFLILTKVIFAYVIFSLIALLLLILTIRKFRNDTFKLLALCVFANVLTLPYLIYTYRLTEKFPYYSNSGGQCIYWLSTPYEEEQGEWVLIDNTFFKNKTQFQNHSEYLNSIENQNPVQKDESLKEKAIENIKNNPKKFLKNYISNVSRLFLDIPNSYTYQSFAFILKAIPNSFIFVFLCISLLLTLLFIKNISLNIIFISLFTLLYLFGSSLLCAYSRMLFPILPFLFLWIFYIINLWKSSDKLQKI